jgi:hypothetical protein
MYTFIRLLMHIFGLLLDLLVTCRLSNPRKDMEILLLRQQLRILQRKSPHTEVSELSARNLPCDPHRALAIAQLWLLQAIRLSAAGIAGHQIAADTPGVVQTREPFLSVWSGT